MAVNLKDLTTPPTEDELLDSFLGIFAQGLLPVTQWQPGSVARTIAKLLAKGCAGVASVVSKTALSGFNSTATGAWLTILSREVFGNDRYPATFARGSAVLALSSALAGPYTVAARQLWFVWNGKLYRNTTGGTLSFASPLTVSFSAESAGADYNAPDNGLAWKTPLAGASVTSSTISTQGTDEETDASLRLRNSGKWGTVGIAANAAGYQALARAASVQVTRCRVRENYPVDGTITLRLAGPSGGVDAGVLSAVDAYINGPAIVRRALCTTVVVQSSDEQTVVIAGQIRVLTGTPGAGGILALCVAALAPLATAISEGGTIFLGDLYAALEGVQGVQSALLTSPTGDTVLDPTKIPVFDTSGLTLVFT
jgi:phage-related baseplate assembly protein